MLNAFILLCVCLWRPVDATDEINSVGVMEGDDVTLHSGVNGENKYLLIQWHFESTRIAEISRLTQTNATYGGPEERFRDRLHLDKTGSLTITNTRTTDSGLYELTVISRKNSYLSINVTVHETPQSVTSPKISTTSDYELSSLTVNQTDIFSITEVQQTGSSLIHCCGYTETMVRLVLSAFVSVTGVAFLVYDIKSSRNELNRMEMARHRRPTVYTDHQYELSRRLTSRYVC